jgi:hypothetical protein
VRDLLAGLLILGGLAAIGYSVWAAVRARLGRRRREGRPRARTLLIAGALLFLLGGVIPPGDQPRATSAASAVAEGTATAGGRATSEPGATTATTTVDAGAAAAQAAAHRERARAARAAKRAAARAAKQRSQRRAAARRKAARVRARRATRRAAARRAAEAERQAALAAAPATEDPSQYAGMNCSEIGHAFSVTPGSDPEHDRDGDGGACETS